VSFMEVQMYLFAVAIVRDEKSLYAEEEETEKWLERLLRTTL
jgi:hypothetical protein